MADHGREFLAMLFSVVAHVGVMIFPATEFGMGGAGAGSSLVVRVTASRGSPTPAAEDVDAMAGIPDDHDPAVVEDGGRPDHAAAINQVPDTGEEAGPKSEAPLASLEKLPRPVVQPEPRTRDTADTSRGEPESEEVTSLAENRQADTKPVPDRKRANTEQDTHAPARESNQADMAGSKTDTVSASPSNSGEHDSPGQTAVSVGAESVQKRPSEPREQGRAPAAGPDQKAGPDIRSVRTDSASAPDDTVTGAEPQPHDIADHTVPADNDGTARQASADRPKPSSSEYAAGTVAGQSPGGTKAAGDTTGQDGAGEKTLVAVEEPDVRAQPAYGATPRPAYPERARELGQQGTVILLVLVDMNGNVAEVEVVKSSGYPLLDGSALATVKRKWQFKPGTINGDPVASRVRVPIRFRISR